MAHWWLAGAMRVLRWLAAAAVVMIVASAQPVPAAGSALHGVKAQLMASFGGSWEGLDAEQVTHVFDANVPSWTAVGWDMRSGTLGIAPAPAPEHDGEPAGCTLAGGAAANWMPSPPAVMSACVYQEHFGGVTRATLACAGATPAASFGCAIIGVELPARTQYFGLLCGYPNDPAIGIEDPEHDVHLHCESFGDPSGWVRWAATMSENGSGASEGKLEH
jgi:hypothetical protein